MKKVIAIILTFVFATSMFCGCSKKNVSNKENLEKYESIFSMSDYIVVEEKGYDGAGRIEQTDISIKVVFDILNTSLEEENELLWVMCDYYEWYDVMNNFLKKKGYDISEVSEAFECINVSIQDETPYSNGQKTEVVVTGYEKLEELFGIKFKDTTFSYEISKLKSPSSNTTLKISVGSRPDYLGPDSIELALFNIDSEETYNVTMYNHNNFKADIELTPGNYSIRGMNMGPDYDSLFKITNTSFTVEDVPTDYYAINIVEIK